MYLLSVEGAVVCVLFLPFTYLSQTSELSYSILTSASEFIGGKEQRKLGNPAYIQRRL